MDELGSQRVRETVHVDTHSIKISVKQGTWRRLEEARDEVAG